MRTRARVHMRVCAHTHARVRTHTHKGVRKFKRLRLILVNSQIFNFLMAFETIVVKATKHE